MYKFILFYKFSVLLRKNKVFFFIVMKLKICFNVMKIELNVIKI